MSANFFVTQTNPEIFSVIPRPGGIVNIKLPKRPIRGEDPTGPASQAGAKTKPLKSKNAISKAKSVSKTSAASSSRKSILSASTRYNDAIQLEIDTSPRHLKVQTAVAAIPWTVEFNEYLEPTEESRIIPDPFQDAVDLLAMAVSIIMLMAKGYETINKSYFKWVFSYLKCIRDEFGRTPPNIQGILNHINELTGGKTKSFLEDSEEPTELGDGGKSEPPENPTE